MKIFCYLPDFDNTVPSYVLNSKVDGISFPIPASSLFGVGGNFNPVTNLKNIIKQIGKAGKKCTPAVVFGNSCGNAIWDNFQSIQFTRKHHQDAGNDSLPIEAPVPYYNVLESGVTTYPYYNKVRDTMMYLAIELRKDAECWDAIENFKIGGVNETTPELRMTAADWTDTNDLSKAYEYGAHKWLYAGYEHEKVLKVCTDLISLFSSLFYDKKVVQAYIPGRNGFPTIGKNNQYCLPGLRPKLTEEIIQFGNIFANFTSQHTAYDFFANVPAYSKFIQLERLKFGQSKPGCTLSEFESLIKKAEEKGFVNLEIFPQSLIHYKSLF
jgi:hypothetical protein